MKGNKFLAAALAASMVFSTVPATALSVFADSVSVEAGDTAISSTNQVVVVVPTTGRQTTANDIRTLMNGYDATSTVVDSATNTLKADAATRLAAALYTPASGSIVAAGQLKTLTGIRAIENVNITDKDHYSFTVVAEDGNYDVTVAVEASLPDVIKASLDSYFNAHEFKFASNQPVRNIDIAEALTADKALGTAASDEMKDIASDISGCTFSGNGTAIGDDNVVTLKVTKDDKTYTYTHTAKITKSSDTKDEADQKALAVVNSTVYPDFTSTPTNGVSTVTAKYNGHAAANFNTKVAKDLKDAGYTGSTSSVTAVPGKSDVATPTANGYYTANLASGDQIRVALKYSSDEKTADTDASIQTALGTATAVTSPAQYVTTRKATKASETVTLTGATKIDQTISLSKNSSVALAAQAVDATAAAKPADVAKAVEDAINAQLAKDNLTDNGVTVTVTPVNTASGTDTTFATDGKLTAATVTKADVTTDEHTKENTYKLLVKTSIANDFADWADTEADDTEVNTLVTVTTRKAKDQKATAVALEDKTINLTNEYTKDAKNGTVVSMTATLTPEDTNSDTTWTVKNSDGDDVTDDVLIEKADTITKSGDSKYTNPETADNDATAYFFIPSDGAGTYTVTAKNNKIEASATLTANKNFTDVKNTSYYADPVAWGYAKNVVNGKTEATFGVGQNVTRAEFVSFLYRIAVAQDAKVAIADDDVNVNDTFSDVSNTAYYAKAVQWAAANNITLGKGAKTFDPNGVVTRAEAVTFIYRAKGQPDTGAAGSRNDATAQFTDVADHAYYRAAVTWGVNTEVKSATSIVGTQWTDTASHVVSGTSTTTFNPTGATTREQAISFIARAFYGTL